MEFALNPRHYVSVPVLLWPVLFLRLLFFYGWYVRHGRQVLFAISPDARIVIRHIADDPRSFSVWANHNQKQRRHLAAMHNRDGALEVNPLVIWMAGWFERFGGRDVWICGLYFDQPLPPIQDSS